jgi:hypothetical protein
MNEITETVRRYVAIWNEPDPKARRGEIEALWAPEGATCYRQLDSHGYDEIEQRVAGAYERWVRDKNYIFRASRPPDIHHRAIRHHWEMVPRGGDKAISIGVNLLVVDDNGRIRFDYQFGEPPPPPTAEMRDLVARYIGMWNETDAESRRRRIAELWSVDCAYISEFSERHGRGGIEAEAVEACESLLAKGYLFRTVDPSDGHHNVARLRWQMVARTDRAVSAAGSDFLVLDSAGRIQLDFQFTDSPGG